MSDIDPRTYGALHTLYSAPVGSWFQFRFPNGDAPRESETSIFVKGSEGFMYGMTLYRYVSLASGKDYAVVHPGRREGYDEVFILADHYKVAALKAIALSMPNEDNR